MFYITIEVTLIQGGYCFKRQILGSIKPTIMSYKSAEQDWSLRGNVFRKKCFLFDLTNKSKTNSGRWK